MAAVVLHPPGGARVPAQAFGERLALISGAVTFSSSYTTGGETVDLSPWLRDVKFFVAHPAGGYVFEYDYANKKLKAFRFDYPNAAQGPAVEVQAGTDLSSVTTRFIAGGYY